MPDEAESHIHQLRREALAAKNEAELEWDRQQNYALTLQSMVNLAENVCWWPHQDPSLSQFQVFYGDKIL